MCAHSNGSGFEIRGDESVTPTPTLYPHEVVVKWLKGLSFVTLILTITVAIVTAYTMILLTAIMTYTPSALPELRYTDMAVANTQYVSSAFSLAPYLIMIIFLVTLIIFWVVDSHGE